jgi:cob(I)alamin adenosyltransferase
VSSGETSTPAGRGLLLVYTGNGKGKTTAALGLVFRALGRKLPVAVVQFIKGKWKTGERLFAETLPGLTFQVMGKGFTWESDDLSRDKQAAIDAWAAARGFIEGGAHRVVVLDELTYVINYGFVDGAEVIAALRGRPPHVHVVVTGRNAPAELIAAADLVTEMTAIKHPFEQGRKAEPGIDY